MEYCKICLNAKTPICAYCRTVETPSGKKNKPTQFVGYTEIMFPERNTKIKDVSALIESRLSRGAPIPVEWIIEYNKLLTSE